MNSDKFKETIIKNSWVFGFIVNKLKGPAMVLIGLWVGVAGAAEPGWIRPRTPLSEQSVWLNKKEPIRFEWTGEADKDTVLEVARDPDFRVLLLEEVYPVAPHFTDKLIDDGTYFWRMAQRTSRGKNPHFGPIRFVLVNQAGPVLIFPFVDLKSPELKPLKFYWQEKKGIAQFRFQLSLDKTFNNPLKNHLVNGTQTSSQKLPGGEYYWRVRAEEHPMATSSWSETRKFVVQKAKEDPPKKKVERVAPPVRKKEAPEPLKLASPKIFSGSLNAVLKFRGASADSLMNPPTLKWKKTSGATGYELQISRKSDFTQMEWVAVVPEPQSKWHEAKPGKYFWRVRAVNGDTITGPFSTTNTLELKLPPPSIKNVISQKLKKRSSVEGPEALPVSLSWNAVPQASGYQVLVSGSKKFNPLKLDIKADKASTLLELEEGGNYYIKVAAVNANGDVVSGFSNVAMLKLTEERVMDAPLAKLPPNGASIVSFSGQQMPISFKWDSVEMAEKYRLEISTMAGFKKIIHTEVLRETQFILTKSLPKVRLFWRVRAEQGNEASDWSEVYSFEFAN